jgi:MFS family permease
MKIQALIIARKYPAGVRALFVGWLFNSLGYSMVLPFLTIFLREEMRASIRTVGLVFLGMGVARIVTPLAAGPLCDRFGRRRFLYLSPAARAAAFAGMAAAVHFGADIWTLAWLLALTTALGAIHESAADAYVADLTRPEDRAEVFSLKRVAFNVGWMTGPAVGAFLARTPYSLLFGITAALIGTTAVLSFNYCPESISPAAGRASERLSMASVLGNRRFVVHCAFSLMLTLCTAQISTTLALDGMERVGLDKNSIGWLYTINGAAVILFQLPMNALLGGSPARRRVVLGSALYGLAYAGVAGANSFFGMAVMMGMISAAELIAEPPVMAMATQMAPPEAMGRFIGVFSTVRGLAYSLGPFLGTQWYAAVQDQPLAYWGPVGALAVVAAAGFALAGASGNKKAASGP